jgi:hypothetical protein
MPLENGQVVRTGGGRWRVQGNRQMARSFARNLKITPIDEVLHMVLVEITRTDEILLKTCHTKGILPSVIK